MGIGLTKYTEMRVVTRPNIAKGGYWPDQTDENLCIGQTNNREIWELARLNRPKCHWPDEELGPFFP